MLQNLSIALQVTVIGMGLVFAAILLLWGMIGLLVRVTDDRAPAPTAEHPVSRDRERQIKRRAAAAAVATALAQQAGAHASGLSLALSQPISPWQAVLRSRQMERVERRGRTR